MKTLLLVSSLAVLGVAAGAVADTPTVRRSLIRAAELSLKERLLRIFPDTPISVIGEPRGVYLDGYGAVFTAEMQPVGDGAGLMNAILRPEQKAQVKARKIARIPELKRAMKESLVELGSSLEAVPLDEQVVLEVVIDRFLWEDGSGYPAELIVQAPRRKLVELKHSGGGAAVATATNPAVDAAIKLTER